MQCIKMFAVLDFVTVGLIISKSIFLFLAKIISNRFIYPLEQFAIVSFKALFIQ